MNHQDDKVKRSNGQPFNDRMGWGLKEVTPTLLKTLDGMTTYVKDKESGVMRSIKKDRNEKCDCGSGKKFKRCCMNPPKRIWEKST